MCEFRKGPLEVSNGGPVLPMGQRGERGFAQIIIILHVETSVLNSTKDILGPWGSGVLRDLQEMWPTAQDAGVAGSPDAEPGVRDALGVWCQGSHVS